MSEAHDLSATDDANTSFENTRFSSYGSDQLKSADPHLNMCSNSVNENHALTESDVGAFKLNRKCSEFEKTDFNMGLVSWEDWFQANGTNVDCPNPASLNARKQGFGVSSFEKHTTPQKSSAKKVTFDESNTIISPRAPEMSAEHHKLDSFLAKRGSSSSFVRKRSIDDPEDLPNHSTNAKNKQFCDDGKRRKLTSSVPDKVNLPTLSKPIKSEHFNKSISFYDDFLQPRQIEEESSEVFGGKSNLDSILHNRAHRPYTGTMFPSPAFSTKSHPSRGNDVASWQLKNYNSSIHVPKSVSSYCKPICSPLVKTASHMSKIASSSRKTIGIAQPNPRKRNVHFFFPQQLSSRTRKSTGTNRHKLYTFSISRGQN